MSNKVIKHIQEIIYQMLNTELFPDSPQISKVIPLLKTNHEKLFKLWTYIPTAFNIEIFGKVILKQMSEYFENNDLLFHNQYEFRKHSTFNRICT